jgi:hypothetical protein
MPKRLATIEFSRVLAGDAAAIETNLLQALAAKRTASKSEAEALTVIAAQENLRATYQNLGLAPNAPAAVDAIQKIAAAKVQLTDARSALSAASQDEKDLRGKLASASTVAGSYKDQFVIELGPYIADASQRYVLRDVHLPTRTESSILTTTKSGLLTSVDGKAEDQTAELLASFAASLGAISAQRRFSSRSRAADQAKCAAVAGPAKVSEVIDPTKSSDLKRFIDRVNKTVCTSGEAYTAETTTLYGPQNITAIFNNFLLTQPLDDEAWSRLRKDIEATRNPLDVAARRSVDAAGGIAYRRELPVVVSVRATDNGKSVDVADFLLEVPNHSPVEVLPMKAGVFGKVARVAKFENGVLVSLDSTARSELAQVAELPADLATSYFDMLSKVFALRIDTSLNRTKLSEQEQARLQAEDAERQLRKELDSAREKEDPSESGEGA